MHEAVSLSCGTSVAYSEVNGTGFLARVFLETGVLLGYVPVSASPVAAVTLVADSAGVVVVLVAVVATVTLVADSAVVVMVVVVADAAVFVVLRFRFLFFLGPLYVLTTFLRRALFSPVSGDLGLRY